VELKLELRNPNYCAQSPPHQSCL